MASANICRNLSTEMSNKNTLSELFPDSKLKSLLFVATSESAKAAVLIIASVVSTDDSTFLRNMCISAITSCTEIDINFGTQDLVREAHSSMLSNDWMDGLIGVLIHSLQGITLDFIDKSDMEILEEVVHSLKKKNIKTPAKLTPWSRKGKSNMGMSNMKENLSNAAAVAWQIKEFLMNANLKNALLESPNLKILLSTLMIISQATIEQYSQWEFLDQSAITAYLVIRFSMQMSIQKSSNKDDGLGDASMIPVKYLRLLQGGQYNPELLTHSRKSISAPTWLTQIPEKSCRV